MDEEKILEKLIIFYKNNDEVFLKKLTEYCREVIEKFSENFENVPQKMLLREL